MGLAAKERLRSFVQLGEIFLTTSKGDSFGRYLAEITIQLEDGKGFNVVRRLIQDGYGRAWNGQGKRPLWDPSLPYPVIADTTAR
jgi:endonuclease YncB( thermonuclease family)